MVFSGGVEAMILDYAIAGFISMTALATGYNDNPAASSRPFDANRNGFVFGEGAGVLILESLERAVKRGARIYAEVLGMATSSDAVSPPPIDGSRDARHAVALDDAKQPDDRLCARHVDQVNDAIETHASSVFASTPTNWRSQPRAWWDTCWAVRERWAIAAMTLCENCSPTINYGL
jgi:3-oxoacyl-(acyl-carrier-protein) synthase